MSYEAFAEAIPTMTYEEQINLISLLIEAVKFRNNNESSKETNLKTYPDGYFSLFGSINDDSFVEPEEIKWELDSKREFF